MTGGEVYLAAAYAIVGLVLLGYAIFVERRIRALRRSRESSREGGRAG
ncbi:MAG: hypothetical protein J4G09_12715 [Proteobacteria bacterium]|nr:hypothetical protein [Pseudomonadota bacterium]